MRWYSIVSGILFIMSIIYFALAAPVPVQEKRQACVDVVHIPRDAIFVLGKRADGELEKLAEEFLKTSGKPVESSDAHVSSSPAPPGPDHGSTNVAQAPAPNPPPPTANPNPSMEPQGPSIEPQSPALSDSDSYGWLFEPQGGDEAHKPPPTQTSSGHGLELTLSSPGPDHGSTKEVQEPAPNPASSIADPNLLIESSSSSSTSSSATLSDSEYKWLFEPEGGDKSHIPLDTPPQPNPKKRPWTAINSDPDFFDWNYWYDRVNRPSPPKESDQTSKYQRVERPDPVALNLDLGLDLNPSPESPVPVSVVHPPFTFAGLPTKSEPDVVHPTFEITGSPTEPKQDVVHPPFTITGSPTEPWHDAVDPPSTVTWSPIRPEHDVVDPPFTITGLPIPIEYEVLNRPPSSPDPEFHLDHQSLTTDSQPVDLLAAIYAAKGKGLESRRIFGTARDVGNAAQRELQPDDGMSLDPGE